MSEGHFDALNVGKPVRQKLREEVLIYIVRIVARTSPLQQWIDNLGLVLIVSPSNESWFDHCI